MNRLQNKKLQLLFKLIFIICSFYYILNKISISEFIGHLQNISILPYFLATFILFLSQIFSAYRFKYYLEVKDIFITRKSAVQLYFKGIFFNILLPGGIGGDVYRLWQVSKNHELSKTNSLRVILSERANGFYILLMMSLLLILIVLYYDSSKINIWNLNIGLIYILITVLFVIINIGYYIALKIILKEQVSHALHALKYSAIVQLLSIISALIIIKDINFINVINVKSQQDIIILYIIALIVFNIATIFAMLPLTIGGFGLRELTFLFASNYVPLDQEAGVAFSMIFFSLNIIMALIGMKYTMSIK